MGKFNIALDNIRKVGVLTSDYNYEEHYVDDVDHVSGYYQFFKDGQLEDIINYWLDHYTANGESHYSDTPDWKIREIYWDKIVSRVIEDVNTEMTDEEIDRFCDRLADL